MVEAGHDVGWVEDGTRVWGGEEWELVVERMLSNSDE
jgi:hypothetical protein